MKRRFRNLTLQGKLFAIFSVLMVIAVAVVAINTSNVIRVSAGNTLLERTFSKLVESYDAQILIQNIEAAERELFINTDPGALDQLTDYSGRLDTFVRESLLKADDSGTKADIYALQQVKTSHEDTLALLSETADQQDDDAFWTAVDQADTDISSMYDIVDRLIDRDVASMDSVDTETWHFQIGGLVLSFAALILFAGLAFAAALVISAQIYGPLLAIEEAVDAVRAGTFQPDQLASLTRRNDEIGHLGQAFVTMAASARERRQALEQEAAQLRESLDV